MQQEQKRKCRLLLSKRGKKTIWFESEKTLHERRSIIRNKAQLDLETAHQRLGYRSCDIVRSQDIYLPASIALEGLQKSPDQDLISEIHALQSDLTNHLAYAKQPLQEFSSADQAQTCINNYLQHHNSNNSIKTLAHDLEPMSQIIDKVHDYLLSDVNEAKTTLKIICKTHLCKLCQLIPHQENQNQPESQNNHLPYSRQSHLSKYILTNETAVRWALIDLGLQSCQEAQKVLKAANLDYLPQQYLLNQTYIIENILDCLHEKPKQNPPAAPKNPPAPAKMPSA